MFISGNLPIPFIFVFHPSLEVCPTSDGCHFPGPHCSKAAKSNTGNADIAYWGPTQVLLEFPIQLPPGTLGRQQKMARSWAPPPMWETQTKFPAPGLAWPRPSCCGHSAVCLWENSLSPSFSLSQCVSSSYSLHSVFQLNKSFFTRMSLP